MTPEAISDIERTEQGATIIPAVLNEPLEIGGHVVDAWQTSASALTSAIFKSVSWAKVTSAVFVMTRWVSTPALRRSCSSRTP